MDPASFIGPWREEAFSLWTSQWASIYEEGSEPHALVSDAAENYFLINAVDNDFEEGDLFGLFSEALRLLEAKGPRDPLQVAAALLQQRSPAGAATPPPSSAPSASAAAK
jgi:hypothetical protein